MKSSELRRAWHVIGGTVVAVLAFVAAAIIGFPEGTDAPGMERVLLFASLTLLCVAAVARRLQFTPAPLRLRQRSRWLAWAPAFADTEIGLVLVTGCYAALATTGGQSSSFYPLLYGLVAFAVTMMSRTGWASVLVAATIMELLSAVRGDGLAVWGTWSVHLAYIGAAAVVHAVFLRGLVRRVRTDHERQVATEIERLRESARDYRLISAPLGADSRPIRMREEEQAELAAGSVELISTALLSTLEVLKMSVDARTCVLLWLDARGEALHIKEAVGECDALCRAPAVPIAGALRAVIQKGQQVSLSTTRPGQLPYYEGRGLPGAFAGVPILEGQHVRGALCADREAPFHATEVEVLATAARQVAQVIRTEQGFGSLERAKYEHERFYHASAMLCRALTLEQVMETAFDAAGLIVDYDVAAITFFDRQRRRHRVEATRFKSGVAPLVNAASLSGLEFRDNASLAAMVVKNRHYLPASGELRDSSIPIFTRSVKFRGAESLLVLPLTSADETIGTFTLASRHRHRFRKDIREMLGVIASQVAISLQNAQMYRKMETMATTDGLTGLTNHRTFQERFAQLVERSERHGHRTAVLLCDVDHFKQVNDNYGHPVGDEVLRRVAKVLMAAVRRIDITARYGGEEFVVVLEATELDDALKLAERIRQEVSELAIDSDKGRFHVTMSIGVSAYPEDAKETADLIEKADLALYHAKESGRDRVVSYQDFDAARRARAAG